MNLNNKSSATVRMADRDVARTKDFQVQRHFYRGGVHSVNGSEEGRGQTPDPTLLGMGFEEGTVPLPENF